MRWIVLACDAAAGPADAANGLQMIGFGTDSVGMGGADVAVARDTAALNTNPAGITQIRTRAFDMYAQAAYALGISHQDALGNDQSTDNRWAVAGGFGFTMQVTDRVTAGVGSSHRAGPATSTAACARRSAHATSCPRSSASSSSCPRSHGGRRKRCALR